MRIVKCSVCISVWSSFIVMMKSCMWQSWSMHAWLLSLVACSIPEHIRTSETTFITTAQAFSAQDASTPSPIYGSTVEIQHADEDRGNRKTLTTTFTPDNASFGNMFDIMALEDDVVITSLDIHTDLTVPTPVSVYTKPGTYVGYESNADAWTNVLEMDGVLGLGKFNPTPLPPESFTPVTIKGGSVQAFYVTLSTEDLLYTNSEGAEGNMASMTQGFGEVYRSNSDLQVFVGSGVIDVQFVPGGITDGGRVFNGNIHYKVGSEPQTSVPTAFPTTSPAPSFQYESETKSLETIMEGGNGGFGAMFFLQAKSNMVIRSIDFHTDLFTPLTVEVYTRPETYVGYEEDPSGWKLISKEEDVLGQGDGEATLINPDLFIPVQLREHEKQAFYVTLTTRDLRYTNTDKEVGALFASNDDLDFFVGVGVAEYPFEKIYKQRVFNGHIHYSLMYTPSHAPSASPTALAVKEYQHDALLESTFEGGNGSYGALFDVRALQGLVIRSIDFHTDLMDETTSVQVWTKRGTYQDSVGDVTAWTLVANVDEVSTKGEGRATPIPENKFRPIAVDAGQIQAFYVSLSVHHLQYTNIEYEIGTVYSETKDVQFLVGSGVGSLPFLENEDATTYGRRVFNGIVHYAVRSQFPTASPTSSPTAERTRLPTVPSPPGPTQVVSQQLIQIVGLDDSSTLEGSSKNFFEGTTKDFLNNIMAGQNPPVHIDSVDVADPEDVKDLMNAGRFRRRIRIDVIRHLQGSLEVVSEEDMQEEPSAIDNTTEVLNDKGSSLIHNSTRKSNDKVKETSNIMSSNQAKPQVFDIYTTIRGEYNPPPFVDFSVAVEDSFVDEGEVFVRDLKEGDSFFEEAVGVNTTTVSFPIPTPNPPEVKEPNPPEVKEEMDLAKKLHILYASCGGAAALILAFIAIWFVRRRRKRATEASEVSEAYENHKPERRVSETDETEHGTECSYYPDGLNDGYRTPSQRSIITASSTWIDGSHAGSTEMIEGVHSDEQHHQHIMMLDANTERLDNDRDANEMARDGKLYPRTERRRSNGMVPRRMSRMSSISSIPEEEPAGNEYEFHLHPEARRGSIGSGNGRRLSAGSGMGAETRRNLSQENTSSVRGHLGQGAVAGYDVIPDRASECELPDQ